MVKAITVAPAVPHRTGHWRLLYYDAPRGQISENEHRYTVGTLHAFAVWTPHSIRPWPYREWAAGEARVTVQTFGIRCGEWWVMYH